MTGMANPRNDLQGWKPRVAEFMGGHKAREMGNYGDLDVNPNENADGLSHHTRGTPEDTEALEQRDPAKRKKATARELLPGLQHISIKPEKMDEMIERSPMMESENKLLESRLGVDLGANGLSLAAGSNVGSVRSTTPNVTYGHPSRGNVRAITLSGDDESFEDAWSVTKGKRKYKGRKYEEDEESEAEKRRSKAKRRRQAKRRKRAKKAGGRLKGGGAREPKSASKRHRGRAARQLDLYSPRQRVGANVRSLPLRNLGSTRDRRIPLRLRDPVAWERKKAQNRMYRARGPQPRQFTHHSGAAGTGISSDATRGVILGGGATTPNTSTRMPSVPGMGTALPVADRMGQSMKNGYKKDKQRVESGYGDPLGNEDYLRRSDDIIKAKGLTRIELLQLKRKINALLDKLNKLTKAGVELGAEAKRGAQASPERSSDNAAKHYNDGPGKVEDQAAYRFADTSTMLEAGVVGKR